MHAYPHTYVASASGTPAGFVPVTCPAAPAITTAAPPQFDGPEGYWSPESLLIGARADCFILTFRAVSRAARLDWSALDCSVEGVLEKVDGATRFSRFHTRATLTVPAGTDAAKARQLLERAEHLCLIANSMRGERTIDAAVVTAAAQSLP